MDLAMDIAASMDETKRNNPEIGFFKHVRSGMRVGRAVIGTMTTTLLLAYSSSHIAMFLLFMAKGLPSANTFNAPFVAAEVLNILVGSFGLITVAPFTVLVAGLLYRFEVKAAIPEVNSGRVNNLLHEYSMQDYNLMIKNEEEINVEPPSCGAPSSWQ
jgi:uncharacterized membrane protein